MIENTITAIITLIIENIKNLSGLLFSSVTLYAEYITKGTKIALSIIKNANVNNGSIMLLKIHKNG